jgi:hypothetical protein
MLHGAQVRRFIEDGFVRIDGAFPREIADEARAAIWQTIACDPDDPRPGPVQSSASGLSTTGTECSRFRSMRPPTLLHSMTHSTSSSDGGAGDAARMWARSSCASPHRPTRAT